MSLVRRYSSSKLSIVDVVEAMEQDGEGSVGQVPAEARRTKKSKKSERSDPLKRTKTMPEGAEKAEQDVKAKTLKKSLSRRKVRGVTRSSSYDSGSFVFDWRGKKGDKSRRLPLRAKSQSSARSVSPGKSNQSTPSGSPTSKKSRRAKSQTSERSASPGKSNQSTPYGSPGTSPTSKKSHKSASKLMSSLSSMGSTKPPKDKPVWSPKASKKKAYKKLGTKLSEKFSKSMTNFSTSKSALLMSISSFPEMDDSSELKSEKKTKDSSRRRSRTEKKEKDDRRSHPREENKGQWSFRRSLTSTEDKPETKKKKSSSKSTAKKTEVRRSFTSPTDLRRMSASFTTFEELKSTIADKRSKTSDELLSRKAAKKKAKRITSLKEPDPSSEATKPKKVKEKGGRTKDSSRSSRKERTESNPDDDAAPKKKKERKESESPRRGLLRRTSSDIVMYARSSSRELATKVRKTMKKPKKNKKEKSSKAIKKIPPDIDIARKVKRPSAKKDTDGSFSKESGELPVLVPAPPGPDFLDESKADGVKRVEEPTHVEDAPGIQTAAELYALEFNPPPSAINFDAVFKEKSENLMKVILSAQTPQPSDAAAMPSDAAMPMLYQPQTVVQPEETPLDPISKEIMKAASPKPFLCPISDDIMRDPVTTSAGSTYERNAIQWWLTSNDIDPLTQQLITDKALMPNNELKKTIDDWKEDYEKKELPKYQAAPVTQDVVMEEPENDGLSAPAVPKEEVESGDATLPEPAVDVMPAEAEDSVPREEETLDALPPAPVDLIAADMVDIATKKEEDNDELPENAAEYDARLVSNDIGTTEDALESKPEIGSPYSVGLPVVDEPEEPVEMEDSMNEDIDAMLEKLRRASSMAAGDADMAEVVTSSLLSDTEAEEDDILPPEPDISIEDWKHETPTLPPLAVVDEPEESVELEEPMNDDIEAMIEKLRRASSIVEGDAEAVTSSLLNDAEEDPTETSAFDESTQPRESLPGFDWTTTVSAETTSLLEPMGDTPTEAEADPTETSALNESAQPRESLPGYDWTAPVSAETTTSLLKPMEETPTHNWTASEQSTKSPDHDWGAASQPNIGFWPGLAAVSAQEPPSEAAKDSTKAPKAKAKFSDEIKSPEKKKKKDNDAFKKMSQSTSALMDILSWEKDSDSEEVVSLSSDEKSDESSVARKSQKSSDQPRRRRRKSYFDSDSDSDDSSDSDGSEDSEDDTERKESSMSMMSTSNNSNSLGESHIGASIRLEDLASAGQRSLVSEEEDESMEVGLQSLPEMDASKDQMGELPIAQDRVRRSIRPTHASLSALDYVQFTPRNFVQQREERFDDYYELGEMLGEGEFGEVFIGYPKQGGGLGEERAIKIIDKERMCKGDYEQVINEFNLLKGLTHPNLLTLYGFYEDDSNCYIVTDLCKGGELWDELDARGNFEEAEIAAFMTNLLSAVKFLQSHKIVHRDINLENILLEENKELDQMKIIDFGLATKYEDGVKLTDLVGKVHYVAPEVLNMSYEGAKYDVWSCGVVAFILLSGYAPFEGDSDGLVMEQVTMGLGDANFNDPAWDDISDEAKDFVRHLLTYDENERPTAEQALKHAWIQRSIKANTESFMQSYGETSITCFENMQDFASDASYKLKQAVYTFIASQLLLKEEREEIDKVFRGMDDDCDGKLSKPDIKKGYKRFFDKELSDKETDRMFDRINTSKTGFIDYTEFVIAAMQKSKILDTEKLRAAFSSFDRGDKGFISANDLKIALSGVIALPADSERGSDGIVQEMMDQVDVEGDGKISYDNFEDMMMATGVEPDGMDEDDALKPTELEPQGSLDYDFASASFIGRGSVYDPKQGGANAFLSEADSILEE